ncbi:MAG: pyruvate,orthophosphate dikinase [Planctomycetota bacterium]|jgi:pyruvate,orthophosphate dikinase
MATRAPRPKKKTANQSRAKQRYVYWFGDGIADGSKEMKNLLGGKGANLAEMCNLGVPVPPGFTISTDVCTEFNENNRTYPKGLQQEIERSLKRLEKSLGKKFGDSTNPLLLSVRSGARVSMPGMMDTVLNLGLNDETVVALAERSGNERFAWDAYRRFVQMYGDVVMEVKRLKGEHFDPFTIALEKLKKKRKAELDTELSAEDLKGLVKSYKQIVRERTGEEFPVDPMKQLWGAINAVFLSWENERAISYRVMHNIPSTWGTAVSVMAMVFGNMGPDSGTGVAFTRDPASGQKRFYGEYLMNAQGEDVVAGIRTPLSIESLAASSPAAYKELFKLQQKLEKHYKDMQDLEFTIEDGRLFMLQCRIGKRTGFAAVRIAVDMVAERLITKEEAIRRIDPEALDQLLAPIFDPKELERARKKGQVLTKGLNAGPGAATGRIVFDAARAEQKVEQGKGPVILVRVETSPEDIRGMQAAVGILTARGGMTSHAALVARQMGKVCVAGAGELDINYSTKSMVVNGTRLKEGDWISLDGTTGELYAGQLKTRPSEVLANLFGKKKRDVKGSVFNAYQKVMKWSDEIRTMKVRTNADQPDQCDTAILFGAEGIGLCRTEHMFFEEAKIESMRKMIVADSKEDRRAALAELLPLQRKDFEGIFKSMGTRPVTIRTLDPPLHEFLPTEPKAIKVLAKDLGISVAKLKLKIEVLHELNPMLGNRGCRLGISYPEITRMQTRAIFEAACNVAKRTGKKPRPEIMVPLVGSARELQLQEEIIREVAERTFERKKMRIPYLLGTMIELPRAALTADKIAKHAEFFSFGTNDLTQTTYGISRDDAGRFIPIYIDQEVFSADPFARLDQEGVGRLMQIACDEGRKSRPNIKLGICGEHGGEPSSIDFCHQLGLAYVSCSPFRVPIARLAAAQAALRHG